ncbi:MAG: winged helix-turn-helix domain-containing protein [Victivallales bacterium]
MEISEEIRTAFSGLDAGSSVPLYRQLEEKIAVWIKTQPAKTFFPSERDLASELNLSRRTVRKALEPFMERGLLERSQKGTFIASGNEMEKADSFSLGSIHPLNFAMGFPRSRPKHRIRVLLYENMPRQILFWKKTVEDFNAEHSSRRVELSWDFPQIAETERLIPFLRQSEFDLIQLPVTRIWNEDIPQLFSEPGPRLQAVFHAPEYRTESITSTYPEMLHCSVPVAAGFRILTCNMNLLHSLGLEALPKDHRTIPLLLKKPLPEQVWLIDHLSNFTEFGFKLKLTAKERQMQVEKLLYYFQKYPYSFRRLFLTPPEAHGTYDYRPFLQGKTLFSPNASGGSIHFLNEHADFEQKHILSTPLNGFMHQINCLLFGINRECRNITDAEDFLLFLLSETQQKRFAEEGFMPLMPSEDPSLAKLLEYPPEQVTAFFERGRELPFFYEEYYHEITDEFIRRLDRNRAGKGIEK